MRTQYEAAHAQRGQTLPMWAFGTATIILLMAFALSYGTMLQWQMRAQNAADSAAQGLLAAQASQWNQTNATLHAAAIEEYRIRYIMNDLLQVIRGDGGCVPGTSATGPTACSTMYTQLRQAYYDAVARYTADVALLNRISMPTFANEVTEIQNALAVYQGPANCGTAQGGDCAFQYTLVNKQPRSNSFVEDVYSDCCAFTVGGATVGSPKQDLTPMEIEIVACAQVQWPIPAVLGFQPPTFYAVGRAAATTIMDTQEFMYVGSINNPLSVGGSTVFQPTEYPESATNTPVFPSTNDANYRIDYGGNPNNPYNQGNPATSDGHFGFVYAPKDEGFLVATGWWSAMPIKPFTTTVLREGTDYQCK